MSALSRQLSGSSLDIDNPVPQLPPGASSPRDNPVLLDVAANTNKYRTPSDKIVLVLVGLPARGKTFVARKIHRYLEFFHAINVKVFNIGNYRRSLHGPHQSAEWFAPDNAEGVAQRKAATDAALAELCDWVKQKNDGRVAILDGTHSTLKKRNYALSWLSELECKVIFLETICTDEATIERNIRDCKLGTPDYRSMSATKATEDFRARVHQYEATYETIDAPSTNGTESDRSWIKLIDCRRFVVNNVRGFLPSKLVQFLSHLHMEPHVFYFSRHGQSEYNVLGKIGGDSGLSPLGDAYSKALGAFCETEVCRDPATGEERPARLWTSTLRRTRETAQYIKHHSIEINYAGDDVGRAQEWVQLRPVAWSNLDELFAGLCDGMTYEEIEKHYPDEFRRRQNDKLAYRYPRGESYLDMIHRLDTMAHEMYRHREPLLIVAHQGILRLLYAYLMGLPREEAPYVSIPLNTVIKLEPRVYGCDEKRFKLIEKMPLADGQTEPRATSNSRDDDPPSH
mmetsp:Transcript_7785/g.24501  ORF Transcript_7785/g.24501 Transcript_7785/m.24501 type:complete len:512 (-) Transcript_7785:157-1692(-)